MATEAAEPVTPVTPAERSRRAKQRALTLGFDTAGVADLTPTPHRHALEQWLQSGMAGTMRYMHRQAARRITPASILEGARYAVVVTRNYYNVDPPAPGAAAGRVARYARGRDYHHALREPLDRLADYLVTLGPAGTVARGYADAGPVPERELAQRAGLGWIGKNTMLIDPARGSNFFLAAVLTSLELAPDEPFEADRCGACTRCLDACPTGAFPAPRILDARRCISYVTIEYAGEVDGALARRTGDWVFGCDVCQDVCPWNRKFAVAADDPLLGQQSSLAFLDLDRLRSMDGETFERSYGWTPLERPGVNRMRRNAQMAAENANREATCRRG